MKGGRALTIVGVVVLVVIGLYGFGRFFARELGAGRGSSSQPAGVLFAAPPGYEVVEGSERSRSAAATLLAQVLASKAFTPRVAVHFTDQGTELYWLVERDTDALGGDPAGQATLRELAGAGATRTESTWDGSMGDLRKRLTAAAGSGSLDVPGLPAGERRNLYH
jgi:hypothetical protein